MNTDAESCNKILGNWDFIPGRLEIFTICRSINVIHHIIKGSFGLIHIVTFSKMFQVKLDLINSVPDNLENSSFQLFKKQQYLYLPQIAFVKVNFSLSPIWNHLLLLRGKELEGGSLEKR